MFAKPIAGLVFVISKNNGIIFSFALFIQA